MNNETSSPKRLCSEIQLFDLCDLECCGYKDGRYCTREELISRFERIAEEDERSPQRYLAEEPEDVEGDGDDDGYDDSYGGDEYEADDEEWDD